MTGETSRRGERRSGQEHSRRARWRMGPNCSIAWSTARTCVIGDLLRQVALPAPHRLHLLLGLAQPGLGLAEGDFEVGVADVLAAIEGAVITEVGASLVDRFLTAMDFALPVPQLILQTV